MDDADAFSTREKIFQRLFRKLPPRRYWAAQALPASLKLSLRVRRERCNIQGKNDGHEESAKERQAETALLPITVSDAFGETVIDIVGTNVGQFDNSV